MDAHCWSDAKESYTLHPETDRLDALLLLLATRFGFERHDRLALTRDAVRRELCRGPLVFRYSGAEAEGTFLACAFWLVEAFALLGEQDLAVQQMDAPLATTSGNLGLLHEQMDPGTGAMLGNVPQALSHLALVYAALAVDEGAG